MGPRTEKAIKAVIALKRNGVGQIEYKSNGNHTIAFADHSGALPRPVATFTLKSLIAKRVPKRKGQKRELIK